MNPIIKNPFFPRKSRQQKIFCIGYNKTGTTTLEKVLIDLGYKMPKQKVQEALVVEPLFRGDYAPLLSLCKRYDAFQDMPFSQGVTYVIVDTLFPGSKFILTVRDSDAWFESLSRFHLKNILKKAGVESLGDFDESTFRDKDTYLHKNYMQNLMKRHAITFRNNKIHYDWSLVYNKEHRIKLYEQRNREIVNYFQERDEQLLILDISQEKDNSRIVDFLNRPQKLIDSLPHLNRSR